jgi:hypothetical protein
MMMAVDATQPVYPPQTLTPITSTWGQAVSDAVVQKFTSTTDRANKWINPPAGSLSTIVGSGYIEVYRANGWTKVFYGSLVNQHWGIPDNLNQNVLGIHNLWTSNMAIVPYQTRVTCHVDIGMFCPSGDGSFSIDMFKWAENAPFPETGGQLVKAGFWTYGVYTGGWIVPADVNPNATVRINVKGSGGAAVTTAGSCLIQQFAA